MKNGLNTPTEIHTDEGLSSGIIKGIHRASEKIRNTLGSAMVGATALTGSLVTPVVVGGGLAASAEKVDGAVIVLGNLPHSTVSSAAYISGASSLTNSSTASVFKDSNHIHADTSISRFTVNLSAADIGALGGMLTITGTLRMSTSITFDLTNNPGTGYASTSYQLEEELKWGNNIGTMVKIGDPFDSRTRPNDANLGFTTAEAWLGTTTFTAKVPISSGGVYYLDTNFIRSQTSGAVSFENFSFNYSPIPEPSTELLVGMVAGATLLTRRREKKSK